jgi:hypothetical protein
VKIRRPGRRDQEKSDARDPPCPALPCALKSCAGERGSSGAIQRRILALRSGGPSAGLGTVCAKSNPETGDIGWRDKHGNWNRTPSFRQADLWRDPPRCLWKLRSRRKRAGRQSPFS